MMEVEDIQRPSILPHLMEINMMSIRMYLKTEMSITIKLILNLPVPLL